MKNKNCFKISKGVLNNVANVVVPSYSRLAFETQACFVIRTDNRFLILHL